MRSEMRRGSLSKKLGGGAPVSVEGGMGEGTAAVAVAQRPGAVLGGAALIVHLDVAALVALDFRVLQAQVIGVGLAPDRHQEVAAFGEGLTVLALHFDRDARALLPERHAFGVGAHRDSFALE